MLAHSHAFYEKLLAAKKMRFEKRFPQASTHTAELIDHAIHEIKRKHKERESKIEGMNDNSLYYALDRSDKIELPELLTKLFADIQQYLAKTNAQAQPTTL